MICSGFYWGVTYPKILSGRTIRWLWKRLMCKHGRHLLDEVWSPDSWYLNCDACNLIIHIDKIQDDYVE
jgi:hypothetical protein